MAHFTVAINPLKIFDKLKKRKENIDIYLKEICACSNG